MKRLSKYILAGALICTSTACSDFLDTFPSDALVPNTAWKTETDAQKFLIGCYSDWVDVNELFYWDASSDLGYCNFPYDPWKFMGNGSVTGSTVYNFYNFYKIRMCNTFLENIDQIPFQKESDKQDMIAQVRTIRAYQYFDKNWWLGGIPIIENYESAEEAKVKRNSEKEVKDFVYKELDEAIPLLRKVPAKRGLIAQGTALAIKMRSALYYGDYERALDAAQDIIDLGIYDLDPDYANLFMVEGQGSKEIIAALQYIDDVYTLYHIGMCFYNNAEGGWSGAVPLQNLVDIYEMDNGLTKEEAGNYYDPAHPYAHRDPRMEMTILYPGRDWDGWIFNSLDKECLNSDGEIVRNENHPTAGDNASDTGLSWAKYCGTGRDYYVDKFATNACPIVFRYAEVLLSYAEAANELDGPSEDIYEKLDRVRLRAGMPRVDRAKYNSKETLRELIRRERCVEFAGEGLRRADLVRWKDANGKLLAETVLNIPAYRVEGTLDYSETEPGKRALVTGTTILDERTFKPYHRYMPLPQKAMDSNPNLDQNPGY
ncbi:RagB/SusD family nutrient uptake outer membrane protein [Bacteroides fragilis]|uniref:RagB/SusD family nutrient uptake outer membrane protein n=1 Tax=Bacteroides fragilis TaxID=817 RepID=UPI002030009F|nr:RagB/SusD family nutrient uptake outer membrane protein [Bacteroides fragilis]MCM0295225.1 RagB/SusD family nutrient uptake outer membrane protein [Bacteroides fragilis]